MMSKLKKCSLIFVIAALAIGVFMMMRSSRTEELPATPISNNLEVRGKQLRVVIDRTYKKIVETHAMDGKRDMNLTSVVMPYIPVGMSFDNAEQILRSAGFEVKPRPGPKGSGSYSEEDRYNVVALITEYTNPYLSWFYAPIGILIGVTLTPGAPGDYTKVSKIDADIIDRN